MFHARLARVNIVLAIVSTVLSVRFLARLPTLLPKSNNAVEMIFRDSQSGSTLCVTVLSETFLLAAPEKVGVLDLL